MVADAATTSEEALIVKKGEGQSFVPFFNSVNGYVSAAPNRVVSSALNRCFY